MVKQPEMDFVADTEQAREPGDVLSRPVLSFDLSTRLANCLWTKGLLTVGDLYQQRPQDLLSIYGFGQTCLEEVKALFRTLGLEWPLAEDQWKRACVRPPSDLVTSPRSPETAGDVNEITAQIVKALSTLPQQRIFPNPPFQDFADRQEGLPQTLRQTPLEEIYPINAETRRLLQGKLADGLDGLLGMSWEDLVDRQGIDLDTAEEIVWGVRTFVEKELVCHTIRVHRCLSQIINAISMEATERGEAAHTGPFTWSGKTLLWPDTWLQITGFRQDGRFGWGLQMRGPEEFLAFHEQLWKAIHRPGTSGLDNRIDEAIQSVVDHIRACRGRGPISQGVLRIVTFDWVTSLRSHDRSVSGVPSRSLWEGLESLPNRQQEVVRSRFGIGSCEPQKLEEIAQRLGLSRERTRQIVLQALWWLEQEPTVPTLAEAVTRILEDVGGVATLETLAEVFGTRFPAYRKEAPAFIRLLVLRAPRVQEVKRRGLYCLEEVPVSAIEGVCKAARGLLETEDHVHTVEVLIECFPLLLAEQVPSPSRRFVRSCLALDEELVVKGDVVSTLRRKTLYNELVRVLQEAGEPLHYEEITQRANAVREGRDPLIFHNVHSSLRSKPELFVRVGWGTYGLAEWGLEPAEKFDRGGTTIAELMVGILEDAGEPLPVQQIIERVTSQKHCREASIRRCLGQDERFQAFEDGKYGLREWLFQSSDGQ